jgi:hypothetical protein
MRVFFSGVGSLVGSAVGNAVGSNVLVDADDDVGVDADARPNVGFKLSLPRVASADPAATPPPLAGGVLDGTVDGDRLGAGDGIPIISTSNNDNVVGLMDGLSLLSVAIPTPPVLLYMAVTTPTEVVVARAATTMAPMVILVATVMAVAAVASDPAPAAAEVPAEDAACTAMDWRVELNLYNILGKKERGTEKHK